MLIFWCTRVLGTCRPTLADLFFYRSRFPAAIQMIGPEETTVKLIILGGATVKLIGSEGVTTKPIGPGGDGGVASGRTAPFVTSWCTEFVSRNDRGCSTIVCNALRVLAQFILFCLLCSLEGSRDSYGSRCVEALVPYITLFFAPSEGSRTRH